MPAPESKDAPFVAYCPEFDVASCGPTEDKAIKNLQEALRLTLEGAVEDGNLKELLREAGFQVTARAIKPPKVSFTSMLLSLNQKDSSFKFSYAIT